MLIVISFTGLSPSMVRLSNLFNYNAQITFMRSYNPDVTCTSVWAFPFSLAATGGIEFSFFSTGY